MDLNLAEGGQEKLSGRGNEMKGEILLDSGRKQTVLHSYRSKGNDISNLSPQ